MFESPRSQTTERYIFISSPCPDARIDDSKKVLDVKNKDTESRAGKTEDQLNEEKD